MKFGLLQFLGLIIVIGIAVGTSVRVYDLTVPRELVVQQVFSSALAKEMTPPTKHFIIEYRNPDRIRILKKAIQEKKLLKSKPERLAELLEQPDRFTHQHDDHDVIQKNKEVLIEQLPTFLSDKTPAMPFSSAAKMLDDLGDPIGFDKMADRIIHRADQSQTAKSLLIARLQSFKDLKKKATPELLDAIESFNSSIKEPKLHIAKFLESYERPEQFLKLHRKLLDEDDQRQRVRSAIELLSRDPDEETFKRCCELVTADSSHLVQLPILVESLYGAAQSNKEWIETIDQACLSLVKVIPDTLGSMAGSAGGDQRGDRARIMELMVLKGGISCKAMMLEVYHDETAKEWERANALVGLSRIGPQEVKTMVAESLEAPNQIDFWIHFEAMREIHPPEKVIRLLLMRVKERPEDEKLAIQPWAGDREFDAIVELLDKIESPKELIDEIVDELIVRRRSVYTASKLSRRSLKGSRNAHIEKLLLDAFQNEPRLTVALVLGTHLQSIGYEPMDEIWRSLPDDKDWLVRSSGEAGAEGPLFERKWRIEDWTPEDIYEKVRALDLDTVNAVLEKSEINSTAVNDGVSKRYSINFLREAFSQCGNAALIDDRSSNSKNESISELANLAPELEIENILIEKDNIQFSMDRRAYQYSTEGFLEENWLPMLCDCFNRLAADRKIKKRFFLYHKADGWTARGGQLVLFATPTTINQIRQEFDFAPMKGFQELMK